MRRGGVGGEVAEEGREGGEGVGRHFPWLAEWEGGWRWFEVERWEVRFLTLVVRFCGVRFGSLHFVSIHFTSSWKPLDTSWNIRVTLVRLFALQPVIKEVSTLIMIEVTLLCSCCCNSLSYVRS